MLKDIKIGVRIGAAFAIVVCIFALLAVFLIRTLGTLDDLAHGVDEHAREVMALKEADTRLEHLGTMVGTALVNREFSGLRSEIAAIRKEVAEDVDKARKAADTEEEKAAVRDYEKNVLAYLDLLEQKALPIIETSRASIPDEIKAIDEEADKLASEAMKHVDFLGKVMTQRSDEKSKEFAVQRDKGRSLAIGVSIAACMVAVLLGVVITLGITRPLAKGVDFASGVAKGELDRTLDIAQKDEIGVLAEALRKMVDNLRTQLAFSQGIMHGVAAPFSVFSPQDATVYTNQAMLDLMGIPGKPEDYLGQQSGAFIFGAQGRETLSTRAIRERQTLFADSTVETRRGEKRHVRVSSAPFYTAKGEMLGTVSIWLDQTEATEAKHEAERAKAEGMLSAANKLEDVVEIVTSASEELSAQVEQSSQGAEGQSRRVAETATAMEQMTATVIEVAGSAGKAAETTEIAKGKASDGACVVDEVVRSIGLVQAQALVMKEDMGALGRQADGIGQIMNVISDIADQTNLLALNAAIEAARAGDAGRGFAVVADEVRKLAEKTMTATHEVGEAIRGIQQGTTQNIEHVDQAVRAIEQATGLANKSGEALREIVLLVDHASDQVRSIATASEEQSAASEQINRSIEEVNTISTETAQAMHQAAQAVGDLANQSHVLKRMIEDMQAEGGGHAAAQAKAGKRGRAA